MFRKMTRWLLLIIVLLPASGGSQPSRWPVEIDLSGSLSSQAGNSRASEAVGYGGTASLGYRIGERVKISLDLGYNTMDLEQDDVLDEWEWDYWQDTYIDFIPGAEVDVVNQTLTYTSTDSQYLATFDPRQMFNDLRLGLGLQLDFPLSDRFSSYFKLGVGYSFFTRGLSMTEHWTKRFKLDSTSTARYDYDYEYDLLHFAPSKKEVKLYAMPVIGLRYRLSSSVDLNMAGRWCVYSKRSSMEWLENALGVLPGGEKWLPMRSTVAVSLGLTFTY